VISPTRRGLTCALILCLAFTGCGEKAPEDVARAKLASILRDSLGDAADPQVGFIVNGPPPPRYTHLYVHFDTAAFANLSDSAFALRARDVARFAVRHYPQANILDSVTVAARDSAAWIRHTLTFPVAQLQDVRRSIGHGALRGQRADRKRRAHLRLDR
jgi:hypothetical protein